MSKIFVSGLINLETAVGIPKFPIDAGDIYYDFQGIDTVTSGSGFNISKALSKLGSRVYLTSILGKDSLSKIVYDDLDKNNISKNNIVELLDKTPQTVVLYDDYGNKKVICDLKNIQEINFQMEKTNELLEGCSLAAICNSNFTRPFLKIAKEKDIPIATSVHTILGIHDEYNKEFMEYANILFLSQDSVEGEIDQYIKAIEELYKNDIIVVGMAEKGAMLYVKNDNFIGHFPAVKTRKIVSTVGAGDSLFASFIHFYEKTKNPYYSIKAAILFASYKIGSASASKGFLTEEQVEIFYSTIWK